jgi:hypothetical protein
MRSPSQSRAQAGEQGGPLATERHGHQCQGQAVDGVGHGGAVGCSIGFPGADMPSSVASAGWGKAMELDGC